MEGFDLGSIVAHIKADTTQFTAGLEEAKTQADGFAGKLTTIAVGVAAVADALVVGFGVKAVKAFSESQDLIAQTNAVLKSTAGIAGVTAEAVTNLSKAWESQTKFSDEAVRGAENILLTFTNISQDIFPQTTEAVLDISTALHEDLQSASIQVGKALQDPVLGITALRRVGVNFNDAQKEVIKNLVDTGQSAKAQQLILAELNREFGGSAKAAGDTFSGAMAKLNNKFNDFEEIVGGKIISSLNELFNWYERNSRIVNDFAGVIGTLLGVIAVALILYGNWIILTKSLALAQAALNLVMDMNPIVLAIMAVVVVAALLLEHWNLVKQWFTDFWDWFKEHWDIILEIFAPFLALPLEIIRHWQVIVDWFSGLPSMIKNAIGDLGGLLYDAGKSIIQGLINGVKDQIQNAEDTIKNVANGIKNAAKKVLSIFSPSQVFHELGMNVGQGLVNGMNSMRGAIGNASSNMAGMAVNPASSVISNMAVNNQPSISTSIGNINIASNVDGKRFIRNLTRNQELAVKGLTPVN